MNEQPTIETPEPITRTQTVLNRASVKAYALAISEKFKGGKFTRVGEDFYERCETRLEAELRGLAIAGSSAPACGLNFITKLARSKAEEKLDALARQIVYLEVIRHPSVGCTLK
jgi:hypothetical protein